MARATASLMRAGWSLIDQVISSGTNAVLAVLVARSVSSTDFGGFSVSFTVFSLCIGVTRALAGSPLGVRFAGAAPGDLRRASAAGAGTALALGYAGGLACVIAGLCLDGALRASLVTLGVVLPGLLVQDLWRLAFFAEQRPRAAAANDAVWAVLQVGAVLWLTTLGVHAVGPLILAWGVSACGAALLGTYQARVLPRPRQARRWLRDHRGLSRYLALEYLTVQGGHQAAMLVIAAVGALSTVGALRGAQTLLGPATVLMVGMYSFALPELSRRRSTLTPSGWMRAAYALSAFVTVLGAVWGALFLVLPDRFGAALLGDSWTGTDEVLLAAVVMQVGSTLSIGFSTALHAMDRARVTLKVQSVLSALLLLGGAGGVLLAGAEGAAWGFALAQCSVVPAWWTLARREARRVASLTGSDLPRQRGPDVEGAPVVGERAGAPLA
jgi:O-antigen/teichoic acid export membrane protein